jgi:hypothetical protein
MLARIASASSPSRNTTRSPLPMSVAMMASGSGRLAMLRSARSAPTSELKNSLIFWPPTRPRAMRRPSGVLPASMPG